jgi:chemotaxis response regulator CheB
MPKAAVEIKAAAEVLPVDAIGPRIVEAVLGGISSGKTVFARRG